MDEILIDERKYVSSKQAAKLTGYAKDYIGQLCREGRVQARLVGRSWYVLESAIQDHRFGDVSERKEASTTPVPVEVPWTRQAPRYEAAPVDILPKMRQREPEQELEPREESPAEIQAPESLQNSWKAWFDRVGDSIGTISTVDQDKDVPQAFAEPEEPVTEQATVEEPVHEDSYSDDKGVEVPIHTYRMPPRELMPRYDQPEAPPIEKTEDEVTYESRRVRGNKHRSYKTLSAVRTIAIMLALIFAITAAAGTGFFDKYANSLDRASGIFGIVVHNK